MLRPATPAPLEPLTARTAAAAAGRGAARLAVNAARLARRYPLETAAVTLLALGGFILPFPYWLFGGLLGGVLSIWSRMWLARDKWIAIFGPLVVVIVGTILAAVITGGHGGAVTAYPHAFVAYAATCSGSAMCCAPRTWWCRPGVRRGDGCRPGSGSGSCPRGTGSRTLPGLGATGPGDPVRHPARIVARSRPGVAAASRGGPIAWERVLPRVPARSYTA